MAKFRILDRRQKKLSARHVRRYREILSILIRHGFGDFVTRSTLRKVAGFVRHVFSRRKSGASDGPTRWERIRLILEELGPTFIKFGQILSNRIDLLPGDLIAELTKLQDNVPPFDGGDAVGILEAEFGKPIGELFSRFDREPVASASIAQVHRAWLPDGSPVAVKVRRPDIEEIIADDIEIMYHLASLLENNIAEIEYLNPMAILTEFERVIKLETNFTVEKTNLIRFANAFKDDPIFFQPGVYPEYCTVRVLTMEYVPGIKLSDLYNKEMEGYDRALVVERIADILFRQVFEFGFFHADPHPGNLFVLPDNRICFLDFGMIGYLTENLRQTMGDAIVSVVNRNYTALAHALLKITGSPLPDNFEDFERRLAEMVEQFYFLSLKEINIGDVFIGAMDILVSFNLSVPASMYLLGKTVTTIEGIASRLHPKFEIAEFAKPYAKRFIEESLSPKRVIGELTHTLTDLTILLRDLPSDLKEISQKIKKGRLHIEVDEKSLQPIQDTLFRVTTDITLAIVLTAGIIGSSLIVHSGIPPLLAGIPILGLLGYVVSGVIGIGLIILLIRDRFR
ncbi:MAG: AarF/ABC1/UbiB kinase family protein [Brevinematales bacterium]|nr:AarF/ABC1/UbiB kinase family protein [Brevinematales bacterium]